MNEEFVTVYIEIMSKKIDELTRSDLMSQTRLNLAEKIINNIKSELEKTQNAYVELQNTIAEMKEGSSELDKPSKRVRNKTETPTTNDGGEY
jgi:uncharacterized phage infection (PIP) family protein YhgE